MMNKFRFGAFGIGLAFLLAACAALSGSFTPTVNATSLAATALQAVSQSSTVPPSGTDLALTAAVIPTEAYTAIQAAHNALATHLDLDPSLITVKSIERIAWSDSCLGVNTKDEMCLEVITPGYRILLTASSRTYEYHTDLAGKSVRLASPTSLQPLLTGQPTPSQANPLS